MARIIYYVSPFDETKQREMHSIGKNVAEIMEDFDIAGEPMAIILNGENPDDFDLSYIPKADDVLEIRRVVHGNNSSDKRGLAAVVQIVAIIAATVVSGGIYGAYYAAGIMIAGSIVSAHLNKRAMELMRKNASTDDEGIETQANQSSLANASNEVRLLQPMPLPIGSHRYAPDIFTDSFSYYFNEDNTFGETAPIDQWFYPGITSGNGAHNSLSWAIMPANYIASGFPLYAIKIAPYHFRNSTAPLTPTETTNILEAVKQRYLTDGTQTIRWWDIGNDYSPLVIYHHSPADPMYQRYNLMHFIARHRLIDPSGAVYVSAMTDIFNGTAPYSNLFYFSYPTGAGNKNSIHMYGLYYYPSTIAASDNYVQVHTRYRTFLKDILNGGTLAGNKTVSYATQKRIGTTGLTKVNKTGIRASEQVFNFGIGDLDIKDRKVGAFDPVLNTILANNETAAQVASINKTGPFPWWVGGFARRVFRIDDSKLVNVMQPTDSIPVTDQNQYNWVNIRGKPGMETVHFTFTGNLYALTSGAVSSNFSRFQFQFKYSNEEIWEEPLVFGVSPVFSVQNNNTRKITWNVLAKKFATVAPGEPQPYLEFRIRKMTQEQTNNEDMYTCQMGIENVCFVEENVLGKDASNQAALNLESVRITEQVSIHGSQFKFSALVESKCWVYDADNDTWSWEHTRNPAWWFLYYAYGGFLNINHNNTDTYPYSPTFGWVNYPGHPDSTEQIFGVGLTNDQIDLDKIKEWAAFCEDNALNVDMVLRDDTSCADMLERISNAGRASVSYYSGKLSVVVENQDDVPVCMFGMGNIIAGSFSVDYAVGEPVAMVVGKYTDRQDWETHEVQAPVPFANPDNIKKIEITLEGITDAERAQREVNLMAARQYYQRRVYSWSVDIDGFLAKRGNLAYLSHDSTQYGFSGRIRQFVVESGAVTGIKVGAIIDSSIRYITVSEPNGAMTTYECHVEGETIVFDDVYPIEKASTFIDNETDNALSDYPGSIPEDFSFIAGSKETPGKIVRISEITSGDNMTFQIKAVDEDPAMWAYEYDQEEIDPESFDDSEVVLSVKNTQVTDLGNGLVKFNWENVNGAFIQLINESTGLPLEANGAYSFTGGEVVVELIPGQKYVVEIKPFSIGEPFKYVSKRVRVWPK